jgi:hypothetical protein
VLISGDENDERACQTWDARTFDQYQAIMILPPGSTQVPIAVTFAREADKEEK